MVAPAIQRPAVTIAKSPQSTNPAGILPVSTTGAKPKVTTGQGGSSRHQSTGLKVNIRRLPPGLSEDEFKTAIGQEWHSGSSNVDWYSYIPGKVSKDPAKPSRPSRAYLHLTEAYVKEHVGESLKELQAKTSSASFNDAKGTHVDPALLTPWPTVLESPYGRIPSTKVRKDNRQGTIDQDPEFIDFLQELTNPLVKPAPIDSVSEKENKPEEKTLTPLVQYLKDKKANKAKEAKAAKQSKNEAKEGKPADKKQAKGSKEVEKKPTKAEKAEKATKEPVKVLNKKAAANADGKTPSKTPTVTAGTPSDSTDNKTQATNPTPKQEKKRERGSVAAAAKIVQRDLGLAGGAGRRRKDTTKSAKDSTADAKASPASNAPGDAVGTSDRAPKAPPTEPSATASTGAPDAQGGPSDITNKPTQAQPAQRASKGQSQAKQNQQSAKAAATKAPASPAPTATPSATEAFLKHANPSQGITESLLQSTFAGFGIVTKVDIDKKKGFAYVDFAEPEALQKAIAASPVKIAQGAVVVLERKTPNAPAARGSRQEGRGGRGGGANATSRGGRGRGRGSRQQASTGSEGPATAKAPEPAQSPAS